MRVPYEVTRQAVVEYIKAFPGCDHRRIQHAIMNDGIRDRLAELCKDGTIYYKTIKNPDTGHKVRIYYAEE